MRKIMIAAAVAALASLGAIRHANAQAFYPSGSASVPTHGGYSTNPGSYQGYPSRRPAYPPQYPSRNATTSRRAHDDDDNVRRNDRYGASGYGASGYGASGLPSRIPANGATARSRRRTDRNTQWARDRNWDRENRNRG
jgi:hypothetical protein